MNAQSLSRLIACTLAAGTTLVLFSAVVSISEPQRSQLMAKNQGHQPAVAVHLAAASAPQTADHVR